MKRRTGRRAVMLWILALPVIFGWMLWLYGLFA